MSRTTLVVMPRRRKKHDLPSSAEQRLTLLRDMDDFIAKAFGTYVPPAPAKDSTTTPDAPAKPASAP